MSESGNDESKASAHWSNRRIWQIQPVRDLFWIALIVFLLYLGYYLRAIFTPVLIALALAYLFQPPINWMEKKILSLGWTVRFRYYVRPTVISGLIVVLVLLIGVATYAVGNILYDQSVDLVQKAPALVDNAKEIMNEHVDAETKSEVMLQLREKLVELRENPGAVIQTAARSMLAGTDTVAGYIGSVFGTSMYLLVTISLIPLYFFFIAWEFDPLVRQCDAYIPHRHKDKTYDIIKKMDKVVSQYFRDRVVIGILMGIMMAIGWWLCGVPYWLLLGLLTGALSLIPYAAVVTWPLAVLLTFLNAPESSWMHWLLWPSVVYAVVQNIESWVLTPIIQGRSTEMNAITILIVMFIGGALGGLYGLLLCIPVAACIKILLQEVFLPRIANWAEEN